MASNSKVMGQVAIHDSEEVGHHGSLETLFSPSSVAVIGASRNSDQLGSKLLANLIQDGYNGPIFPVHPKATHIHGVPAFPSFDALPTTPDLLYVVVPADSVAEELDAYGRIGGRNAVIITAGFAEIGNDGEELDLDVQAVIERWNMRVIGPNCMGIINASQEVMMNGTFSSTSPKPGGVAMISQSGALGVALLEQSLVSGIGLSRFASIGNKMNVDGTDLIELWGNDGEVDLILLYLESINDSQRFIEVTREVSKKKPIMMVKAGRTLQGQLAAQSHTGALAAREVGIHALLDAAGVIRVMSVAELFDAANTFSLIKQFKGDRIALVTNAGGPAIMAVDALIGHGLTLAEFSQEEQQAMAEFLPKEASTKNPIDMIASANPHSYRRVLNEILKSKNVDAVICLYVGPERGLTIPIADAISQTIEESNHRNLPVVSVMLADSTRKQVRSILCEVDVPVFNYPEPAVATLALLKYRQDWLSRDLDSSELFPLNEENICENYDEGFLNEQGIVDLLSQYNIERPQQWLIPEDQVLSRSEIDNNAFPVALKATGKKLVHKSEHDAVRLGLENEVLLSDAMVSMHHRLNSEGLEPESYIIQQMIPGDVEVIIGAVRDPSVGPLMMVGLGGTFVEVLKDVNWLVSPASREQVSRALDNLRGAPLLDGVRGKDAVDKQALVDLVMKTQHLFLSEERIQEIEFNPVMLKNGGEGVNILDTRIRIG